MMSYCDWKNASPENIAYHDTEWGVPVHDDRTQFEYLSLEVLQCGLSWDLMIRKRKIFRECFDNFEIAKVATYTEADVRRILTTPGMIRSERKIRAIINNAWLAQEIQAEFGSLDQFLWNFTNGKTLLYRGHFDNGRIPVSNGLSLRISQELKRRGFKFLGPVVVYSHLQACGIINDHDERCPRCQIVNNLGETALVDPEGEVGVKEYY